MKEFKCLRCNHQQFVPYYEGCPVFICGNPACDYQKMEEVEKVKEFKFKKGDRVLYMGKISGIICEHSRNDGFEFVIFDGSLPINPDLLQEWAHCHHENLKLIQRINTRERLPDDLQEVLVLKNETRFDALYSKAADSFNLYNCNGDLNGYLTVKEISHWMPAPKLPEEEE